MEKLPCVCREAIQFGGTDVARTAKFEGVRSANATGDRPRRPLEGAVMKL